MNEIAVKDRTAPIVPVTNGNGAVVRTDDLAIARLTSIDERAREARELRAVEAGVEARYAGLRGYLRLMQISRVIAMLSLYLYLDQYDIHHRHHQKRLRERMKRAVELTRAAVYGEKLYRLKMWFFHIFMLALRRFFVGSDRSKEHNQTRQAVWLREQLTKLGPTFIKIGQSMGTRADLLPLPFVKELGTLVD